MLHKRWLFYLTMLLGIAIAVWIALDPFFGSESAERIRRGGLFLQLLGVLTIGVGIYRILRDSDYILREIFIAGEVIKVGEVIYSTSRVFKPRIAKGNASVEERIEELERGQLEHSNRIDKIEEELEQQKNRPEKIADRLREEWEKALTSNLDLEVVGFVWVFIGIAIRLFLANPNAYTVL